MIENNAGKLRRLTWSFGLVVIVMVFWGGYWVKQVMSEVGIQAREERAQLLALEDAINDASANLAGQVHEWKDILLRNHDSILLEKHKLDFERRAEAVGRDLRAAAQAASNMGIDADSFLSFASQHQELTGQYRVAMNSLKPGNPASVRRVDRSLQGIDRPLQESIFRERERLEALAMSTVSGLPGGNTKLGLKIVFLNLGWLIALLPLLALYFFQRVYKLQCDIAKSDSQAQSIFQSIEEAVLVLDAAGSVVGLNPRAQALLGLNDVDVLGRSLSDVCCLRHAVTGRSVPWPSSEFISGKKLADLSNVRLGCHGDGKEIPIEVSIAPLLESDGAVNGQVLLLQDVTERREMVQTLQHERALFQQTFDLAEVGMAHVSSQGRWIRVNRHLCQMTGYTEEELLQRSFQGVNHPEDNLGDEELLRKLLSGERTKYIREKRYIHKGGNVIWVSVTSSMVRKIDGSPDYGISIIEDISARRMTLAKMQESRLRYMALFEQMPEGALLFDSSLRVVECNPEAMEKLGYAKDALLQLHVSDIEAIDDQDDIEERQAKLVINGRDDFESFYRRSDGSIFPVDVSVKLLELPDSEFLFQTIFRDITEERQAAEQIELLAYHDPLTGLPNRRLLQDRIEHTLGIAKRHNSGVALLYLDLDHFKDVNDAMGHDAGDLLLKLVSIRLQECIREGDTLARIGGDEFVIVLNEIGGPENAEIVAEKILRQLNRPVHMGEAEIRTTPSIGISIYPQDGRDARDLIKHADTALYKAKKEGRSTYRFFTEAMHQETLERINMERLLRVALKRNEFELHYQPQVNLSTHKVIGCEALLRWNQPTMGLVPPAQFIPIAEHTGLILEIGEWVLREACKQARKWQDSGYELKVAINVSARQLMRPGEMMRALRSALDESGVSPAMIELELTESILLDPSSIGDVLEQISALGVHLALDDFGTGYSSLAYLRRFPISIIKIDRSFVCNSDTNAADAEMVRTIIGMAHNLQKSLIAEGVETLQQGLHLAENGCEVAQGFHYSRPLPLDEFESMLKTQ